MAEPRALTPKPRGRYKSWRHPFNRVMSRVTFEESGCWTFQGPKLRGYGVAPNDLTSAYTHRITYETMVGPIPEGLELDHLCRNRACCNPDHLEPVTRGENLRRAFAAQPHPWVAAQKASPTCRRGHIRSAANIYEHGGRRHCVPCQNLRARERRRGE